MVKFLDSMSIVDMETIRGFKEVWVTDNPTEPDMPPVVFAGRKDKPIALIVSPTIDRDSSLKAALVMARTANADFLALISDSFVKTVGKEIQLESGELQRRWNSGDRKDISEALCCVIASKDKDIEFISIPYTLEGVKLTWDKEKRSEKADGTIPEVLREIMQAPRACNDPEIIAKAREEGIEDPERQLFHLARAAFMLLEMNGYAVIDMISEHHPEWIK